MRKVRIVIIFACCLISLASCHTQLDAEFGVVERRIAALEQSCSQLNSNIAALKSVANKINEFDFIKSVTTIYEGYEAVGYKISFTHSSPISIYCGRDAQTPTIGVKKDSDGIYYWCIRYPSGQEEFVVNNFGQKVPTAAESPTIKIENGYWMVTYDSGTIWHNIGKATGDDANSFFESVEDSTDYVKFNLIDGSAVRVPTWSTFEKLKASIERNNSNLTSLKSLIKSLGSYSYAKGVTPILQGVDTLGYRLYLSDGTDVSFYHGADSNMPIISAKKEKSSDKEYYWTIKYANKSTSEWLLVGGKKVRANALDGVTPLISFEKYLDNVYYWNISYDGGATYSWIEDDNGQKVVASSILDIATVTNITKVRDYAYELFMGGNTVVIPLYQEIVVTINQSANMAASQTQIVHYTLNKGDERTELAALTKDGFYARIEKTNFTEGQIVITSPASFTSGKSTVVTFVVADGNGNIKKVDITIKNNS